MKFGLLIAWATNAQLEIIVVEDEQLIAVPWSGITERCARVWRITRLHPEAHSKLSQAGHAPDVGVISHSFVLEMKIITCSRKDME